MSQAQREEQMAQAEELLGAPAEERGFAKGLYFGQHLSRILPEYPWEMSTEIGARVSELRGYCYQSIDPALIDCQAEIPSTIVRGLGQLGVLGACLPARCGGLALSQTDYCRLLEVLGGHCGSTALFVNAHHSIGPRALVLFGTQEQQARWLPKLATGEWLSAFALTEPEAGSDAANVQTQAAPTEDGTAYILNGEKRWITNGGLADVLTVMARTPVPGKPGTHITAFLVTPDMPGFEVVEKRMEKCGVRGTATSRLAFRNMRVPKENVLGQLGKGLKVALTVLDFGRTTFGASCTGAAKFCVTKAVEHANRRVQFGQTLGSFELVKEKLAYMRAGTYAMEACTYQTAALIDAGAGDFMLETAMLKVFATEVLWRIVNDTFQIYGGKAYFTDEPFERMMRDARINMIGEGANDVLRDVGLELEGVLQGIQYPIGNFSRLGRFAARKLGSLLTGPVVDVRSSELEPDAGRLSKLIGKFSANVERLLRTYQKEILDRQYQLGRIADVATELYVSACVLRRLDAAIRHSHGEEKSLRDELIVGRYYLATAQRRMHRAIGDLGNNDDEATTELADRMLRAT